MPTLHIVLMQLASYYPPAPRSRKAQQACHRANPDHGDLHKGTVMHQAVK